LCRCGLGSLEQAGLGIDHEEWQIKWLFNVTKKASR
jgi:hypothetical protein